MAKGLKLVAVLATVVLTQSFTYKSGNIYVGLYAVSASDPSEIKLLINADHTFYYQDFSVASNKIAVHGTWEQKGDKVVLKANEPVNKFHTVWSFEENGKVAKSRKGLCFYRLGKVND